MSTQQLS